MRCCPATLNPVTTKTATLAGGRSCWNRFKKLPDAGPVLGFHVLGVAFLHVERCVPRIDVAERREGADLAGGVRVGHDLLAHRIVAHHRAPYLTPAEEHALVAGEAVEHRGRLALERDVIGVER